MRANELGRLFDGFKLTVETEVLLGREDVKNSVVGVFADSVNRDGAYKRQI